MTAWTDFVREYAKRNNMTYMCAIQDASKEYKTLPKTKKTAKKSAKKPVKLESIPTIVDESMSFMQRKYLEQIS